MGSNMKGTMKIESGIKVAHVTSIAGSLLFLLLDQLISIREEGYEVCGISTPGEEVATLESAGIRHIPVIIARRLNPSADLKAFFHLYKVMRNERFTIVHTHNPKPGLLGQLAARMARVPIVVNTLHGFYFHENMNAVIRKVYVSIEKIAARCSDTILSQNNEDIQIAISEGIAYPHKIKYLGNGINLKKFSPGRFSGLEVETRRQELRLEPDEPVVGFVGRLAARRKGFLDFLEAGRRISLRKPNVRFLIVGGPDYGNADAVEPSASEEYGIADRCVFLGHVPNEELPILYRMLNVLVLPSLFEGVPRVVMEASAMGVPVVVSDVKGNREAVEHNKNGLLVPLGNLEELARAILDLLENRDRAQKMGMEGRKLALQRFDEQKAFRMVKEEYSRLLEKKGIAPLC